jgi:hypothetical protein
VDRGSGGQDEKGQKTQEPVAGKITGARSRGGGSPELANLGTPGRNPGGKRVKEVWHSMRNRSRVTAGFVWALCGQTTGDGGSARFGSPASGVLASGSTKAHDS